MAKRFIDTRMFEDEWVCSLSKDAKLFFIYYITTCDHAGILKLNRSLCEFQTKLKSFDTIIKELGNSLVTLKENVFFMPKFIKFQYPNFPQSNVKQQDGALKILYSYGINDEVLKSYLTLTKDLTKSYDNDNGIVNNIEERKKAFKKTLEPYLEKYGKDLLNKFYFYWTEPNKSNTKFRQETEKTWSLSLRLNTWAENELKHSAKDKKVVDPRNPNNLPIIY
jgi:hypothetical protein